VASANPPDHRAEGWLHTLGITSLTQLDVLAFVCRHRTSLVGGDLIARLLGYTIETVVRALDALESLGLVVRTRATHGVRIYESALPDDPSRRAALTAVLELTMSRAGRLTLSQQLAVKGNPEGSRRSMARAAAPAPKTKRCLQTRGRPTKQGGTRKGGEPWLKAV
jgi:biotin operon repressor